MDVVTAVIPFSLLPLTTSAAAQQIKIAVGCSSISADQALGLKIAAKYLRLEDKELLQRTYESSIDEKNCRRNNTQAPRRSKLFLTSLP